MKRWLGVGDLLIAAMFWGFGFIATVWTLEVLNAYEITLMRFVIAAVAGLPFMLTPSARRFFKKNLKLSFIPAVLLWGTLVVQTWGLNYTTATKSGFITTLYVVMVPVLDSVVSRTRISARLWFFILLAFAGTACILNVGFTEINKGDVLTLICAIIAAGQIFWVGVVSPSIEKPFAFNITQCLWALPLSLPFCLWPDGGAGLVEKLAGIEHWPWRAVVGLFALGLGSTVIAFYLQVRGQARLSATVSSILCLLESPFAMIFAILILAQIPTKWEIIGAAMIFAAAAGASLKEPVRD